jgi:hypothetical protein
MKCLFSALLGILAGVSVHATPLLARNNGNGKASSTPWPAIPDPQSYTAPDGPVKVYPASIAEGLTSERGNATLSLKNEGDVFTRKSLPLAPSMPCCLLMLSDAQSTMVATLLAVRSLKSRRSAALTLRSR